MQFPKEKSVGEIFFCRIYVIPAQRYTHMRIKYICFSEAINSLHA